MTLQDNVDIKRLGKTYSQVCGYTKKYALGSPVIIIAQIFRLRVAHSLDAENNKKTGISSHHFLAPFLSTKFRYRIHRES